MYFLSAYFGAGLLVLWGAAHIIATKPVIKGFGELSRENYLIILMEWLAEGISYIGLGILVICINALFDPHLEVNQFVKRFVSLFLIVYSILSIFTGAKTSIIPMKLCPLMKTISAILIYLGSF